MGELNDNSSKINSSKTNTKDKPDGDKHSICLKAADYKGCMNYQNR